MAVVELKGVRKVYDGSGRPAVEDVDFRVEDGEFMVLLGPSGCGKSTILRMIAGLESISRGTLEIDGKIVNDVPAKDRDIAMVFQSYALYPHMTLRDNMAFGLRRRCIARDEITRRVGAVAESLGLTPFLDRKPYALSGGQRQRVALGRAIVREPKVFLFDEPLSNLDASLRVSTRNELVKLHHRLRTTMIYVTHDQVEAMTMGSRVCIMNEGKIEQIGEPMEVYRHPLNTFVAGFLGNPSMNLLNVDVVDVSDGKRVRVGSQSFDLPRAWQSVLGAGSGRVLFGLRPEEIAISGRRGENEVEMTALVLAVEPLGAETILVLSLPGVTQDVIARIGGYARLRSGETVSLTFDPEAGHLFDAETNRVMKHSALSVA